MLADRYRVVSWDSPGHGETVCADAAPYSFWDLARNQVELMNALHIDRAVVGGVSQGGFTALRTALVAPDRVTSLLLMDTEASALDAGDRAQYEHLFAALAEQGPVDELLTPLAAQIIGDHAAAAEWVARWRERGVPLGLPVKCLVERDDVVSRLPEITCPALLLRGSLDMSIPVERVRVLRDHLPKATEIQVIQGAGHSPTLTHPDATASVIASFLAGDLRTS
jgi:pimeloyl-ACP methyl ester carboxylesterase